MYRYITGMLRRALSALALLALVVACEGCFQVRFPKLTSLSAVEPLPIYLDVINNRPLPATIWVIRADTVIQLGVARARGTSRWLIWPDVLKPGTQARLAAVEGRSLVELVTIFPAAGAGVRFQLFVSPGDPTPAPRILTGYELPTNY